MTGFSQRAWQAVAERYADVLAHPFVTGLGDGSLPEPVFVRYLLDDAHYLLGYARTLAAVAARMPGADGVATMATAAAGAIEAERSLHRGFLLPRGLDPDAPDAPDVPPPTPSCRAYTGYLAERAATAPVEVALAAVLPCFRVYAEVGRAIAGTRPAGEHPYASWIETYTDDAFDAAVRRVEALADTMADRSPDTTAMLAAYAVSTDLEWRFFEQAWRGEG